MSLYPYSRVKSSLKLLFRLRRKGLEPPVSLRETRSCVALSGTVSYTATSDSFFETVTRKIEKTTFGGLFYFAGDRT